MKAKINWLHDFRMEGQTESANIVHMDSVPKGEKSAGASPSELILQALAGCTMMDIVIMVSKAKKKIEKFWIDVDADIADDFPKIFTKIHLTYNLLSPDLDDATLERAIKLSEDKYCRVHAMLAKTVNITSSYKIEKP
ncbi:MAG: OsmC family protein [Ignavibacteria bacterium]